ncbi:MAG: signal peptide peptidase SppA [Candidatus Woesearchaeota archaeon]
MANKWAYAIFLIIGLAILSFLIAGFIGVMIGFSSGDYTSTGNVMLISLSGPISNQPTQGIISTETSTSSFMLEKLKNAKEDPTIEAVVISIDSPGGGAVASHKVVEAMKKLDKPSVTVIQSMGASGAYWVASASDMIYADPLSMIGSIGVTSSYLEVSDLLKDYNITYERLVSGDFKDAGSPLRSLEDEERAVLQRQLDRVHEIFIEDVADNRDLSDPQMENVSDGRVFLGDESIELGLIDKLGGLDDAKSHLEDELNISVRFRKAKRSTSMFPFLSGVRKDFAFNFGRGFASWLTEDETSGEMISLR